jgi:kynurenine formamidase
MAEVVYLEELASEAIYEFVFIGASLRMRGATAGPIRPLALPLL